MNAKFVDKTINYEEIEFRCDCSEPFHAMYIGQFRDEPFAYCYMAMGHYAPWYKRLWMAIKYVFKLRHNRGGMFHYAELVLNKQDMKAMVEWLQELSRD